MIKLLIRQIFKRWRGLIPVLLVWLVAGYLIFSDHHRQLRSLFAPERVNTVSPVSKHNIFRKMSYALLNLPEEGTEKPDRAFFDYILQAEETLKQDTGFFCKMGSYVSLCDIPPTDSVRLDLMEKACERIPRSAVTIDEKFPTDWLEQIRTWDLDRRSHSRYLTEPDSYWAENQERVLRALQLSIQALQFAYEIPPEVHQEAGRPTIVIPALVEKYGRAVCHKEAGIMAWGDFVRFQEIRAYKKISESEEDKVIEKYAYPTETDLLVLNSLSESRSYLNALEHYSGGSVPDPWQTDLCGIGNMLLSCYAPEEAKDIYNRMLYFSAKNNRTSIYLNLGKIYVILYKKYRDKSNLDKALNYFTAATQSFSTERDSRLMLIRLFIEKKEFISAHKQLEQMARLMRNRSSEDEDFRKLARLTLMGLGKFSEADCYADLAELSFGKRSHCETMPY